MLLKTMYLQFVIGGNAKVTNYGLVDNDKITNKRFYTYVEENNEYSMTVYIEDKSAFHPKDLQHLIAIDFIEIDSLKFTENLFKVVN